MGELEFIIYLIFGLCVAILMREHTLDYRFDYSAKLSQIETVYKYCADRKILCKNPEDISISKFDMNYFNADSLFDFAVTSSEKKEIVTKNEKNVCYKVDLKATITLKKEAYSLTLYDFDSDPLDKNHFFSSLQEIVSPKANIEALQIFKNYIYPKGYHFKKKYENLTFCKPREEN